LHYICKNYKIILYFVAQKEDRFLNTKLKIDKEDKDMRRLTNRNIIKICY